MMKAIHGRGFEALLFDWLRLNFGFVANLWYLSTWMDVLSLVLLQLKLDLLSYCQILRGLFICVAWLALLRTSRYLLHRLLIFWNKILPQLGIPWLRSLLSACLRYFFLTIAIDLNILSILAIKCLAQLTPQPRVFLCGAFGDFEWVEGVSSLHILETGGTARVDVGCYGLDEVRRGSVWINVETLLGGLRLYKCRSSHNLRLVPVESISGDPNFWGILTPSRVLPWVCCVLLDTLLTELNLILLNLLLYFPLRTIIAIPRPVLSRQGILLLQNLQYLLFACLNNFPTHLEVVLDLKPFEEFFLLSIILFNDLLFALWVVFIGEVNEARDVILAAEVEAVGGGLLGKWGEGGEDEEGMALRMGVHSLHGNLNYRC